MTYYVCFAFMLVFLFTGSGVLNGQIIPLIFPRGKNSDKFVIATTATIAVILLFIAPLGDSAHYRTTGGLLGKLYSNTMMVVLNNRIVLQAQDESIMLGQHASSLTSMTNPAISQRPAFSTSHSGTSQHYFGDTQTVDDVYKIQHVSICYPGFSITFVLTIPIFIGRY